MIFSRLLPDEDDTNAYLHSQLRSVQGLALHVTTFSPDTDPPVKLMPSIHQGFIIRFGWICLHIVFLFTSQKGGSLRLPVMFTAFG